MSRLKNTFDRKKWEETQITTMDEFKNRLKLEIIQQIKEAERYVEAQDVSQKLNQISKDSQNASKEVSNLIEKAQNLAEDSQAEDDEELSDEEAEELNLRRQEEAKKSLLDELNILAKEASDNLDYKLAYKVERAIDSIIYDEE